MAQFMNGKLKFAELDRKTRIKCTKVKLMLMKVMKTLLMLMMMVMRNKVMLLMLLRRS
jgi:hypothetical protein